MDAFEKDFKCIIDKLAAPINAANAQEVTHSPATTPLSRSAPPLPDPSDFIPSAPPMPEDNMTQESITAPIDSNVDQVSSIDDTHPVDEVSDNTGVSVNPGTVSTESLSAVLAHVTQTDNSRTDPDVPDPLMTDLENRVA